MTLIRFIPRFQMTDPKSPVSQQGKAEMHPVQTTSGYGKQGYATSLITLKAYEVYCEVFSPQPAMVDLAGRNCRGGFSVSELIAFLYAHNFPRNEWAHRVDEAISGMKDIG